VRERRSLTTPRGKPRKRRVRFLSNIQLNTLLIDGHPDDEWDSEESLASLPDDLTAEPKE